MLELPPALAPMGAFKQFCLYKLVPSTLRPGKTEKYPCDLTGAVSNAHDPTIWLDAETALKTAPYFGDSYGVAFVFTEADPFFFLDLDDCLQPTGWSPLAMGLLAKLRGAAVEVSQSGSGLHVFGQYAGPAPAHACKNTPLGLELYTSKRFVALTGKGALGSAALDCTLPLASVIAEYFAPSGAGELADWPDTSEPVAEYTGPENDDDLIKRACASKSNASAFEHKATFADLWTADEDVLTLCYPDGPQGRNFDASDADAALAQHLAFWTGKDAHRMMRLMLRSGLVRDKWEQREGYYLERTILRAVGLQERVYSVAKVDTSIAETVGAPKLKGSPKQKEYAETIRAQKLTDCLGDVDLMAKLCAAHGPTVECKFWIENQHSTPEELAEIVKPLEVAASPLGNIDGPELITGYQFLGATQQMELFEGCVYIQDQHRIFTPTGALLKSDQFNATYGGYSFQKAADGGKTTDKAWDAFVLSQAVRYPKAESTCFRPELPPGTLVQQEGQSLVNTYVPIDTPRATGDISPFLTHLAKVIPNLRDQEILLAYMAACVQHKGVKFQWAPLIQGTYGNGKTLFTRCVSAAVGRRYSHWPKASEIGEKFNEWLFGKVFIGVEEVHVPDQKREMWEVLKTMITNEWQPCRAMQTAEAMRECCANFIFNANPTDALRKTEGDRRIAPFFTAQQSKADKLRDGMGGDYFPNLYNWLKGEGPYASHGWGYGYAIVTDYLTTYAIPDELNPAKGCQEAPITSSTAAAISAGLGGVEQEILEAVHEGRQGFAGGWISSMALERLLQNMRRDGAIPPNKRRELLQALGYDWHPVLRDGRVNNHISIDGGKPRLFIKAGHLALNLTTPGEVVKAYEQAQTGTTETAAEVAFGKGQST